MEKQAARNTTIALANRETGAKCIIVKVKGEGAFRKRITEMGFVKGKTVTVIKNAPLKDPVEYEVMGYKVSLRRSEAEMIETIPALDSDEILQTVFNGVIEGRDLSQMDLTNKKTISVALVGNPNCGKTTLFNYASGAKERVGNYAGVTVDIKEAHYKYNDIVYKIADLPGTYSITEYSPEELFVRKYITERKPDVVINVIDASNIERNLFLTTQLIDMGIKVVIALNMYDELEVQGAKFDYQSMGKMIGIPITPTVASKGKGLEELFQTVRKVYEGTHPDARHIHINHGSHVEKSIQALQTEIRKIEEIKGVYSTRYLAIKLLENDLETYSLLSKYPNYQAIKAESDNQIQYVEKEYQETSSTTLADIKYGFIAGALKETFVSGVQARRDKTKAIDSVLTNRYLGFPIFILFMWLTFQATFTIGSYPMDWIDSGVGLLANTVDNLMPEGSLKGLIVDGIIGGVGGVIIFLPNILILFFFISLMEDTGYMSRAAFIMDKLMHKIGLHGKSFIPMVMGFGCNVPAVMATRTLDNKNDRLLTMLIMPFMSCSARLPVYVLLISAFFHTNQGLVLFSIYIMGILLAVLIGLLFKNTFFKKKEVPFVMELPPYRIPTLKNTSIHMWHKGVQYLQKMGGVILVASVIIWALSYFPKNVEYSKDYSSVISQIEQNATLDETLKEEQISQLELEQESERQMNSYIGRMGQFIEPVIRPLGFDWKIGVSIITGLAAKEIVVSSMGVLYNAELDADETSESLMGKLQNQTFTSGDRQGEKVFSPLVAYTLMIFVLIYFPCVAVIAAIKKESNWKWAVFTMVYTTVVAWVVSLGIYQIGSLFV